MGGSAVRGVVSSVLVILFPFSLLAADSGVAMLYTSGPAWVNGAHVPHHSSAIFSGDLLQTRSDSVANINEPGSSITVLSDSLVRFELASLEIEHGSVTVSTAKKLETRMRQITVAPVSNAWTEYAVTDLDGIVTIAARRGDVKVNDGEDVVTLPQGQETTRNDSANAGKDGKKKRQQSGAAPAAHGGTLNAPLAVGLGGAAAVGLGIWATALHNDEPLSPDKP